MANVVGEGNYGSFFAFLLLAVLAIGLHVLLVFPQGAIGVLHHSAYRHKN